jgi:hypothetical protein
MRFAGLAPHRSTRLSSNVRRCMATSESLAERTNQKLRFARIVLRQLDGHPSRHTGDDYERSHFEAFLFHFYGALDAFLQELNVLYGCGLELEQVSRRALEGYFAKAGSQCAELLEMRELEQEPESYLCLAREMRHYVAHRGGLPMAHYFNGPSNLVHPVSRTEFAVDSLQLLGSWLEQLDLLLGRLRASATERNV